MSIGRGLEKAVQCSDQMHWHLTSLSFPQDKEKERKCSWGDSKGVIRPLSEGREHLRYCVLVK